MADDTSSQLGQVLWAFVGPLVFCYPDRHFHPDVDKLRPTGPDLCATRAVTPEAPSRLLKTVSSFSISRRIF